MIESYLRDLYFFKEYTSHNHLEKLNTSTLYQIMNYCKTLSTWKFSYFIYCKALEVKASYIFQVPK